MSWSRTELDAALQGRYEIVRELGRGGMAVVFLARDLRHSRHVALKVMRPELASSVAGDRFLREMEIAAQLAHPHILPLLDSGDADGVLYYVMPFIEGETLRQRIERERQLAVIDSLAIVKQVASALDYAHGRGVVHRDIKPENILLLGGEVLVADFGLGRLLYSGSTTALTESGMAVGTPQYMSPEQGAGDQSVDVRTDIYSLGCVLFEMIAGIPPFQGATAQAIIAHHFRTPAPSLRRERETCPEPVDSAIQRAMAKVPADRFKTAGEFVRALENPSSAEVRPPRRPPRLAAAAIAVLAVLAAAAGALRVWGPWKPRTDSDLVAIVPFRISPPDTSVADFRVGIVDLLHERFPNAVNSGKVLSAWERATAARGNIELSSDEKLQIARNVGAGQLLAGSIVKVPAGIELHASLIKVRDGKSTTAVASGQTANIGALVDTVANKLLSQQAGEQDRFYLLKDVPTSALRFYIEGKDRYRRGRYDEALALFERALDSSKVGDKESTFVLAAFGLVEVANYNRMRNTAPERGLEIAWQSGDRLHARDRAFLLAQAGSTYPAVATRRDRVKAWDQAKDALRDRPEAYVEFADEVTQFTDYIEWSDARPQAFASLERALQIDSTFVPGLQVLADLLVSTDLPRAEQIARRLPSGDSATDKGDYIRWRIALARGDQHALTGLRDRFDKLQDQSLRQIWLMSQVDGIAVEDADRALEVIARTAVHSEERETVGVARYLLQMNQGRPAAAVANLKKAQNEESFLVPFVRAQVLRDWAFGDGNVTVALEAHDQIAKSIRDAAENPNPTDNDKAVEYLDRCGMEQWRLAHRNTDSAAATLRRLSQIIPSIIRQRRGGTSTTVIGAEPVCPAVINAWAAAIQSRPNARAALDSLDRIMADGPMDGDAPIGNLLIARLRLANGDSAGALRALKRRPRSVSGLFYLAASLRDEGKVVEAMGDRAGAIRAYSHYLALRAAPEPALQNEVDDIRARLNRLQTVAVAGARRSSNGRKE